MDPEEPDNSHVEEWKNKATPMLDEANGQSINASAPSDAPAQQQETISDPSLAAVNEAETTVLSVVNTGAITSNPVLIPQANRNTTPSDTTRGHNRTHTPNGIQAASSSSEGPITPRNDAGPWVFDGSAGRVTSLDSAMDVD